VAGWLFYRLVLAILIRLCSNFRHRQPFLCLQKSCFQISEGPQPQNIMHACFLRDYVFLTPPSSKFHTPRQSVPLAYPPSATSHHPLTLILPICLRFSDSKSLPRDIHPFTLAHASAALRGGQYACTGSSMDGVIHVCANLCHITV
jgi:hypothetical protein